MAASISIAPSPDYTVFDIATRRYRLSSSSPSSCLLWRWGFNFCPAVLWASAAGLLQAGSQTASLSSYQFRLREDTSPLRTQPAWGTGMCLSKDLCWGRTLVKAPFIGLSILPVQHTLTILSFLFHWKKDEDDKLILLTTILTQIDFCIPFQRKTKLPYCNKWAYRALWNEHCCEKSLFKTQANFTVALKCIHSFINQCQALLLALGIMQQMKQTKPFSSSKWYPNREKQVPKNLNSCLSRTQHRLSFMPPNGWSETSWVCCCWPSLS